MQDALKAAAVMRVSAHRYLLLLVDRVQTVESRKRAEGLKRGTGAESLGYSWGESQGESQAIMPSMLVVEALAQTSAVRELGLAGSAEGVVGSVRGIGEVHRHRSRGHAWHRSPR